MDLQLIDQFKLLVEEVPGFIRVKCTIEVPANKKNMHEIITMHFSVNKENDDIEFSPVELTKVAHKIRDYFKDHRVTVNMKITTNDNNSLEIGV